MAWIRTQEKSTLLNVGAIWVGRDIMNKSSVLEAETTPGKRWRLGSFACEEDAMIELNLIDNWLANGAPGVFQVSQGAKP